MYFRPYQEIIENPPRGELTLGPMLRSYSPRVTEHITRGPKDDRRIIRLIQLAAILETEQVYTALCAPPIPVEKPSPVSEAQVAKLREALTPFAALAKQCPSPDDQDLDEACFCMNDPLCNKDDSECFSYNDLIHAQRVLAETEAP